MINLNQFILERLKLNNQSKLKSIASEKDYYNEINKILDNSLGNDENVTRNDPTFKISGWPSTSNIDFFKEIAKDIPCYLLKTDWMKNNIYEFNVDDILKYYNLDYKKAIEEISNMIDRYMSVDPYES